MAFDLDRCGERVDVPISRGMLSGDADQMRDCGVSGEAEVALMVKLRPKFFPDIVARFESRQRTRRVIRYFVAAVEFAPSCVIERQHGNLRSGIAQGLDAVQVWTGWE